MEAQQRRFRSYRVVTIAALAILALVLWGLGYNRGFSVISVGVVLVIGSLEWRSHYLHSSREIRRYIAATFVFSVLFVAIAILFTMNSFVT